MVYGAVRFQASPPAVYCKVYIGTYSGNPVAVKDFQSRSSNKTVALLNLSLSKTLRKLKANPHLTLICQLTIDIDQVLKQSDPVVLRELTKLAELKHPHITG